MAKVFISYRREDTRHLSARVYEQFEPHFADGDVFFDVDTLPRFAGLSFPDIIRTTVPQCQVFLAIIGPHWARLMQARLTDADDWVQIEIGMALETPGVRVIPVLVDGAPMPKAEDLPPRLQGLLSRQAIVLPHDPHFRGAVRDLARTLSNAQADPPPPPPLQGGEGASSSIGRQTSAEGASPPPERGRQGGGQTVELRAAEAARAGRPIAERAFPIELPGVSGWPGPQMIAIPPGRFTMGSPEGEGADSERPQHEVRIDHVFALGRHAVTFAEWDAALAAGAKLEKPGDQGWGRDRRPVINVSWNDALAYLDWLNTELGLVGRADAYRLPSEAEWEYACRAGTKTRYSVGDTITRKQAQFSEGAYGSAKQTVPVGSFPANAFGLHDVHGNVWEWCADAWHQTYEGAPTDGAAWLTQGDTSRVYRGGSWFDGPSRLRSADRVRDAPANRGAYLGFRLARTL